MCVSTPGIIASDNGLSLLDNFHERKLVWNVVCEMASNFFRTQCVKVFYIVLGPSTTRQNEKQRSRSIHLSFMEMPNVGWFQPCMLLYIRWIIPEIWNIKNAKAYVSIVKSFRYHVIWCLMGYRNRLLGRFFNNENLNIPDTMPYWNGSLV